MVLLEKEFSLLSFGNPQRFRHLAVFPLLHASAPRPFYATLDEALAHGVAHMAEVSKDGRVSELRFINRGDLPVLLLDGEEILGGKQNRIMNLTILAAPRSELNIPVSCVEQGRWQESFHGAVASDRVQHSAGRVAKLHSVSASLACGRGAASDQGQVWEDLREKARRMGTFSHTGAMADMFEQTRDRVEDYTKSFSALPGQTGAIFAVGGRVIGLEVFYSADTLARLLPKLIRSYAVDAMEVPGNDSACPASGDATSFLNEVMAVSPQVFPGLGLGETVRLHTPQLAGGGLTLDGHVIHLAAMRSVWDHQAEGTPRTMRRASERFRRRSTP